MTSATKPDAAYIPGLTIPEFEDYAGLGKKLGYREVKLGRVRAYRDGQGHMRISPFEAYAYIRNKEQH